MKLQPRLAACAVLVSFAAVPMARAQQGFPPVPVPPGNPITFEKTQLGKALFFEEQLSSTGTVACATCHTFETGGSDRRSFAPDSVHPGFDGLFQTRDDVRGSRGVPSSNANGTYNASTSFGLRDQVTSRRGMTVINAVYAPEAFWDGRATNDFRDPLTNTVLLPNRAALESQAVGPLLNDVEMTHMGTTWNDVVQRLAGAKPLALASSIPATLAQFVQGKSYPELFRVAFGTTDITPSRIAMAIATYERTLISDHNRLDDFLAGNRNALTPQEQRGNQIFTSPQTRCIECHGGPLGTDHRFHYTGVTPPNEDLGRFTVTNAPQDRGAMRTPSIRNVALRAPYFHDGSAQTLEDVVAFYNRGGNVNAPNKDPRIRPLGLTMADQQALVAFLRALTDDRVLNATAPFDRPKLFTESDRVPSHYGAGTPGSNNIVPVHVAYEPLSLDRSHITIGVDRGYGGSAAMLLFDAVASTSGIPVLGIRLHLGVTPGLFLLDPIPLSGSGAGAGYGSIVLDIPNDPALRGKDVFTQWVLQDNGLQRLTSTDGVRLRIF
ncbi:MAG: hypothetical protein H6832_01780 [Planctomycetes bacterium]|nr:hypothetical protein [Planctomycetota bacterium]